MTCSTRYIILYRPRRLCKPSATSTLEASLTVIRGWTEDVPKVYVYATNKHTHTYIYIYTYHVYIHIYI